MSIKQLDTGLEKSYLDIRLNTLTVHGTSSHQNLTVAGDLQVNDYMTISTTSQFSEYEEETLLADSFDTAGNVFPTPQTSDILLTRVGNLVTISIDTILATSKGSLVQNFFSSDNPLPPNFIPTFDKIESVISINNNILVDGAIKIGADGIITIYRSFDQQLNYTASSQCGLDSVTFTYHV